MIVIGSHINFPPSYVYTLDSSLPLPLPRHKIEKNDAFIHFIYCLLVNFILKGISNRMMLRGGNPPSFAPVHQCGYIQKGVKSIYLFYPHVHPLGFISTVDYRISKAKQHWRKGNGDGLDGQNSSISRRHSPFFPLPSVNTVWDWNKSGCRKRSLPLFVRFIADDCDVVISAKVYYSLITIFHIRIFHFILNKM